MVGFAATAAVTVVVAANAAVIWMFLPIRWWRKVKHDRRNGRAR